MLHSIVNIFIFAMVIVIIISFKYIMDIINLIYTHLRHKYDIREHTNDVHRENMRIHHYVDCSTITEDIQQILKIFYRWQRDSKIMFKLLISLNQRGLTHVVPTELNRRIINKLIGKLNDVKDYVPEDYYTFESLVDGITNNLPKEIKNNPLGFQGSMKEFALKDGDTNDKVGNDLNIWEKEISSQMDSIKKEIPEEIYRIFGNHNHGGYDFESLKNVVKDMNNISKNYCPWFNKLNQEVMNYKRENWIKKK